MIQSRVRRKFKPSLDAISPSSNQSPIFADIEQVREEKGADMVAPFRYLIPTTRLTIACLDSTIPCLENFGQHKRA